MWLRGHRTGHKSHPMSLNRSDGGVSALVSSTAGKVQNNTDSLPQKYGMDTRPVLQEHSTLETCDAERQEEGVARVC